MVYRDLWPYLCALLISFLSSSCNALYSGKLYNSRLNRIWFPFELLQSPPRPLYLAWYGKLPPSPGPTRLHLPRRSWWSKNLSYPHPGLYIVARDSVFVTELFIGIYSDCRKIISLIGYKADIEYRFTL